MEIVWIGAAFVVAGFVMWRFVISENKWNLNKSDKDDEEAK